MIRIGSHPCTRNLDGPRLGSRVGTHASDRRAAGGIRPSACVRSQRAGLFDTKHRSAGDPDHPVAAWTTTACWRINMQPRAPVRARQLVAFVRGCPAT